LRGKFNIKFLGLSNTLHSIRKVAEEREGVPIFQEKPEYKKPTSSEVGFLLLRSAVPTGEKSNIIAMESNYFRPVYRSQKL